MLEKSQTAISTVDVLINRIDDINTVVSNWRGWGLEIGQEEVTMARS